MLLAGAGRWGQIHARRLHGRGDALLAAVWDRDRGRAEALAGALGPPAGSPIAVVEHAAALPDALDAAVVAVSSDAHVEVAAALLQRDVAVLLEKPLACDAGQLERLLEAAEGRLLVPAMIERFNPAFRAAVAATDPPGRGQALFLQAERLAPLERALPGAAGPPADVILDLMIHDLDLVHQLVDGDVAEVRAVGAPVIGPHCDMAHARLAFEGGEVAVLAASRAAPRAVRTLRVFGTEGYWSLDLLQRAGHRVVRAPGFEVAPLVVGEGDALVAQHTAFLRRARAGDRTGGGDGLARAVAAHRVAFELMRVTGEGLRRWLGS